MGTWKTNKLKVQGRSANQGPTFRQLLNKYTKAIQQDRPFNKMLHLQGGSSSGAGVIIRSFLRRRYMLPCLGLHRLQMWLIRCGNMKRFGSSAFQCHTHHHIRGRKDPGRQYITDSGHTNLVRRSGRRRSDPSPMTGQTNLSRDRRSLLVHRWNIA